MEASDAAISVIVFVRHRAASVVFDPRSTYSYVSIYHAVGWDLTCDSITVPIHVSTPVGVYFKSREEHERHLRTVLGFFKKNNLFANFSKCELWLDFVAFLGHVLSKDGIMVDPQKIDAVRNWARPTTVIKIRSFVGLADSYYRQFLKGFTSIALSLSRLIQKDVPF
ncbi:uncharacterized mitochondrial protein AtMg00860-like [Lycium ferocissimum]|uniref:uncharacterized mitochondrial protein AtMg00860-like n=1 Tax=Lycium ferocissimum TaxID=112874 RepID=UPI002814CA9B|nr:uncharacterized mitochondrial protein AtMg00860-like [Lycium ferocissimum]